MKLVKCIAACAALLLATGLTTRAEDPKPAIFGHASISSLDEAKKLITELGIPFPGDPTKMIESAFPFIGPGGIQTDKPAGVFFIAGENTGIQQLEIIALPVVQGKATVAALSEIGGQPVPDHPDMVKLGEQVIFRRSPNYIMFYLGAMDLLASVNDDPFAKDYTYPGRIAQVTLDLAAARTAAPGQYKAFLDSLNKAPPPGTDVSVQKAGEEIFKNAINGVDRLSLAVARDGQSLQLKTSAGPFEIKGSRKFPQPAFPTDVIAQMHIIYPSPESAQWFSGIFKLLPDSTLDPKGIYNADQRARAKALVIRMFNLLGGPDAQSVALSNKAGKPVLYVVNQYVGDLDFAAEVQAVLAAADKFDKEPPTTNTTTTNTTATDATDLTQATSTYQSAVGKPVNRILFSKKGVTQVCFDYQQTGHIVTMTFARDDGKYLEAAAALPATGEMSDLCSGSFKVGDALKAAANAGQGPPLPPELLKQMVEADAGLSITWTCKPAPASKDVDVDIVVPMALIKEAGTIATELTGPPGGGPLAPVTVPTTNP